MARAQWQALMRRLLLLVEHSDGFTPAAFVKRLDECMPELRKAAMAFEIEALMREKK